MSGDLRGGRELPDRSRGRRARSPWFGPVWRRGRALPAGLFRTVLSGALILLAVHRCVAQAEGRPDTVSSGRVGGTLHVSDVRVGLAGTTQVGRWTPVRVTITAESAAEGLVARGEVETLDPLGRRVTFASRSRRLGPGKRELAWSFLPGRLDAPATLRVLARDHGVDRPIGQFVIVPQAAGAAAESRPGGEAVPARITIRVVPQSVVLWATVGPVPGFDRLDTGERWSESPGTVAGGGNTSRSSGSVGRVGDERRRRVIALEGPGQLPADAAALEALRTLVVAGDCGVDAEQSAAIREWVFSGGHLVLSLGDTVDAYSRSPLREWVPVEVGAAVKMLPDTRLSALESLAGRAQRILFSGRIPAADLQAGAASVLADSLDGPLVLRAAYGMGLVTVVAVDLRKPPFLGWTGLPQLCEKLGEPRWSVFRESGEGRRTSARRITKTGISELATQVHVWLERFPEVRRPGTWTTLILMVAYLAVIGPLDYLVVHRWLKRPHWTWATLAMLVALWALAVGWAAQRANAVDVGLNAVAVWDIDAASGRGRATTWCAVYGEENRRVTLGGTPPVIAAEPPQAAEGSRSADARPQAVRLRWEAVAEDAFGGMYRPSGIELFHAAYRVSAEGDRLIDVPLLKWSTFCWRSRWLGEVQQGVVQSNLRSRGVGRLSGTVRHRLPGAVREWILAYQGRVYWPRVDVRSGQLPEWEPGTPINLDSPRIVNRELRGYLTGTVKRRILKEGGISELRFTEQKPYPIVPEDIVELIRMLTFHEAAGGKSYTRLNNYSCDEMDLSGLLDHRRAVLFGVLDADDDSIRIDGEPVRAARQHVFVRLVLPVEQDSQTPRSLLRVQ